jgi:hypothetical protein
MPILQLHKTTYWSQGDENAMFGWLDSIPGVRRYWGVGVDLFVSVRFPLSRTSKSELEALWRRYGTPEELASVQRALSPRGHIPTGRRGAPTKTHATRR